MGFNSGADTVVHENFEETVVMKTLKIALDWTPNTNHTGFFVASTLGFYREQNLDIEIVSPASDDYRVTPSKKLELGLVDLAVVPTESLMSLRLKPQPIAVKAIFTLLREDTSTVVTLKSSGIDRPRKLDGQIYASFGARYEDRIIRQMVINDGGLGALRVEYPSKLGIWETILAGTAHATWIFKAWEGIEAKTQGVELNDFDLKDYAIPYGYSPLVMAKTDDILSQGAHLKKFVAATRQGYMFAQQHPEKAVEILTEHVPVRDLERIDLLESQRYINPFYGVGEDWGRMDAVVFQKFIDWLFEHCVIEHRLMAPEIFTNVLL